ncbi:ABC transporter permease subunit [Gordonia desulfuricans]|uniref:ABC transporter permease subunit n=1 Tax=Gordonia desulfuricans TaxID=89051 RepID=A0A7K3LJ51_9ACTN|nr:ABC transporter permease subunit [Gordonia desulfuricans]NDK88292.1 ABC transporter permease subunit [Gordonia desulfuricans]
MRTPARRTPAIAPRVRAVLLVIPALVIVGIAVVGPWIAPHRVDEGVGIPYAPASSQAPAGTDHLGQDVWSHLLTGGWGLLLLATMIALLVTFLAAVIGTIAAVRPAVGDAIERCTDLLMLVPPVLAILLVMLSWPQSGAYGLVGIAVVIGTTYSARVFAAAAAGIAVSGYVEVAVASGERLWYLVFREVLPNLRHTVTTQLGLRFVEAMYLVSTAAFLQLPATLGRTNWAVMVRENGAGILLNPWAVVLPSIAIGVLAISVNLTIDALRPDDRRMRT